MDNDRGPAHRARKRFGQHFLIDASVVAAIVAAIDPRSGQTLVEIGPGLAALTQALLERVPQLHAVEIDRDLADRLRRRFPPDRVVLHEADALAFDYRGLGGVLRIVGNLPYNISSPLLVRLLAFRNGVEDQHFMLQKEVVERIVARPGTRAFGRLSVLMQAYYDVESLFDVPARAFDPPPRVESAVVRMVVRRGSVSDDPAPLQRVLHAGFGQRRKMIRGTLLPWLAARGVSPDLDPTLRPEQLDVSTWLALAARLPADPDAARGKADPV